MKFHLSKHLPVVFSDVEGSNLLPTLLSKTVPSGWIFSSQVIKLTKADDDVHVEGLTVQVL